MILFHTVQLSMIFTFYISYSIAIQTLKDVHYLTRVTDRDFSHTMELIFINIQHTTVAEGSYIGAILWYMTQKTFSEELRGCSAQTLMDSCAVQHGSCAGQPRILRTGGHESSAESGWKWRRRWTSCATMLKDRASHCKDRSNYYCRNRAPFDLPLVHFTMIFSMAG